MAKNNTLNDLSQLKQVLKDTIKEEKKAEAEKKAKEQEKSAKSQYEKEREMLRTGKLNLSLKNDTSRVKPKAQKKVVERQRVILMDSTDKGWLLSADKNGAKIELDNGLTIDVGPYEYAITDYNQREALAGSFKNLDKEEEEVHQDVSSEIIVDLHIEAIPGGLSVPPELRLRYQLDYFNKILRRECKHRGRRIVFIHGVGEGILAAEIRKQLEDVYSMKCRYNVGIFGKTVVIIK